MLNKEDGEESVCMFLKEFPETLFNQVPLKGIPEIQKVTFTKYDEQQFNSVTGGEEKVKENYMIETDGVALQKVLGAEKIDFKRTCSNDIIEDSTKVLWN